MWVEMIGLPGVGKTTLIEKNIGEIQKQYKIIKSSKYSLYNSILTKMNYLRYFTSLSDKKLLKKLCYRLSFRQLPKSSNVFFYDSGLIQVVLENLIETDFKDADAKINFLKKLPLPDCIIYLEDNTQHAVKNELERPNRLYSYDEKELNHRYEKTVSVIEKQLLPLGRKIAKMRPADPDTLMEVLNK